MVQSPFSRAPTSGGGFRLDPVKIHQTAQRLHMRVQERFPHRGLTQQCAELERISEQTIERIRWFETPHWRLKGAAWVLMFVLVCALLAAIWLFAKILRTTDGTNPFDILQTVEAATQQLIFVAGALWFLLTLEGRWKRGKALYFLRELRSMAHLVDLRQLDKDPHRLSNNLPDTASSPRSDLTAAELGRYLDYCSEMVSLISKLAALYAERLDDAELLQAVDEVEDLTNGIAGRVWQKISLIGPK
jgi:hypothetical protein